MEALQQQTRAQHTAHRGAVTSLHAAQQNTTEVRARLEELQVEKSSLQESAERMQEDMKADSQVCFLRCVHQQLTLLKVHVAGCVARQGH